MPNKRYLPPESQEPGTPTPALLKGGEEKSPCAVYNTSSVWNVLDAYHTVPIRLPDNPPGDL